MSEQPQEERSFALWFWIFALVTVVLIAFFQTLTIWSAHSLGMMVLVRQMSIVYDREAEKFEADARYQELKERLDAFDPYSKKE